MQLTMNVALASAARFSSPAHASASCSDSSMNSASSSMCLRLTLPLVGDANSAAAASLFGDRALLGDALIGDALIGDALIGAALLGEGSGKSRDDFRGDSRGARGACSSEVNMLMSARGRNGLSWPRDSKCVLLLEVNELKHSQQI